MGAIKLRALHRSITKIGVLRLFPWLRQVRWDQDIEGSPEPLALPFEGADVS